MHYDHTEGTVSFERVLFNWDIGKARTCKRTGQVFGTRKELRMHLKQFQQPREHVRPVRSNGKKARRVKAVREIH